MTTETIFQPNKVYLRATLGNAFLRLHLIFRHEYLLAPLYLRQENYMLKGPLDRKCLRPRNRPVNHRMQCTSLEERCNQQCIASTVDTYFLLGCVAQNKRISAKHQAKNAMPVPDSEANFAPYHAYRVFHQSYQSSLLLCVLFAD